VFRMRSMTTKHQKDQPKYIKSVEILYPDSLEFGPSLNFTRTSWRAECLKKLYSGKAAFEEWQLKLISMADSRFTPSNTIYKTRLIFEDGTTSDITRVGQFNMLDFAGHKFEHGLDAFDYEFLIETSFDGAVFEEGAEFTDAIFRKNAWFTHVEFDDAAWFRNVKFLKGVEFNSSIFSSYSFFNEIEFHGWCEFINVFFHERAIFKVAKFSNVGQFEGAIFEKQIPDFRGCKIDSTRLEFSKKSKFSDTDVSDDAIERVGFLKRLSDEHGQTDQALRFNAIELRIKRLSPVNDIGFKVITWLYEKLSDYGRSFIRPIFGYVVLLAVSALFVMTYSTYSEHPEEFKKELCNSTKEQPQLKLSYERAVAEYAMFRAGGLMDFTDTGKQNNAVNCRLFEEPIEPPLMRAWGIFKGRIQVQSASLNSLSGFILRP
jgi:hypothetical protein